MLMSIIIQILSFIQLGQAQVIYPEQRVEYTRYKQVKVFKAQDIERKILNPLPIDTLRKGQILLPCIYITDKGLPLRDGKDQIYLGFEILEEPHKSLTQSVENNHCPSWIRNVVKASQLILRYSSKASASRVHKPPAIKPWLVQKMSRLKSQFNRASYYRNKRPFDLAYEFHNTQCPKINQKPYRRGLNLKEEWSQFVEAKSQISQRAFELAEQARHIDLTTRTALYESNYGDGCNARAHCERQIISLTIYNRANSSACKNGSSYLGCRYTGDYAGIATKASQYNIWFTRFPIISNLTGCFLREDLQKGVHNPALWEDPDNEKGYHKRIQMYKDSFNVIGEMLFDRRTRLEDFFKIRQRSLLRSLENYFHPKAMPVCHYETYARSSWVTTSYVKRDDKNYFLLRRTRILTENPSSSPEDSHERFLLYSQKTGKTRDTYPGGLVASLDIDRTHNFLCTAYGTQPTCKYKKVKYYKKMPKWLLGSATPKITCLKNLDRGAQCNKRPRSNDSTMREVLGGNCAKDFLPVVVKVRNEGPPFFKISNEKSESPEDLSIYSFEK